TVARRGLQAALRGRTGDWGVRTRCATAARRAGTVRRTGGTSFDKELAGGSPGGPRESAEAGAVAAAHALLAGPVVRHRARAGKSDSLFAEGAPLRRQPAG